MSIRRDILFAFLASLALGGAHAARTSSRSQTPDDEVAIRELLDRYVVHWRDGDGDGLARLFELDNGYVIWLSRDGHSGSVGSMSFADIVARDKGPIDRYGHSVEVLSIDVVDGQLATAKVAIGFASGTYIDVLVLYKVSGEWKIVAKTFVTRVEPERGK